MATGTRYGVEVRAAQPADAPDLAPLLGLPGGVAASRLADFQRGPGTALLVAAGWNGAPIGLIALHWHPALEDDRPVARIEALTVAEEERRNGIGRLLVKAGSQAARQAGCGLMVASGSHGEGGRAFLAALGFAEQAGTMRRNLRKRAPESP